MLLNSIICQMDLWISIIFSTKLIGACSQISLLIPVTFEISVNTANHNIVSDIEFSSIIK